MKLHKMIGSILAGRTEDVGLRNVETREAWLRSALASLPSGARILDAGAGRQKHRPLCADLRYVSQDFAAYDGKGNEVGMQTGSYDYGKLDIVSDITAIPEPDASFDAVMCIEVIEHVPDPGEAVRELARLLKPGGTLLLSAPFCSITHYAPYHFSTGFSRYWYETHLPRHGIEITRFEPNGNYFEYLAQELRRVPEVAARYGGGRPNRWQRLCSLVVLGMLAAMSRAQTGSAELLCFGCGVTGRKR